MFMKMKIEAVMIQLRAEWDGLASPTLGKNHRLNVPAKRTAGLCASLKPL
jgi:hypothetical protein